MWQARPQSLHMSEPMQLSPQVMHDSCTWQPPAVLFPSLILHHQVPQLFLHHHAAHCLYPQELLQAVPPFPGVQ